jgi:hypothetical protein
MSENLGCKTKSKLIKKKAASMSVSLPAFFLQSGVNKNKKIKMPESQKLRK